MKSEKQVVDLIEKLKNNGVPLSDVAWQAARACVGWPYVYGAVGEECKPKKRSQYGTKFYPKNHTTIVDKCQAISWDKESQTCKVTGACAGCKWGIVVLMFDCRGLTRKILQMVYNWTLWGGTVGGQWNDERNWKAKGEIATMPKDTLCCLFVYKDKKWQHTGFGFNNETVECSSGVQYFSTRNKKWTHWAVPKCVEGQVTIPDDQNDGFPDNTGWRATIRKGSKGEDVKECQTMLQKLGYDLGSYGVDGDFGTMTRYAVINFQRDHGLVTDGVVGPLTWDALIAAAESAQSQKEESVKTYSVIIKGLDLTQAKAIAANYPATAEIVEGGDGK